MTTNDGRPPTCGVCGGDFSTAPHGCDCEGVVVLRAEDLIPERARCARTVNDDDTRYCRECMQKPCRWFGGWRPSVAEELGAVPQAVAAEVARACDDSPSGKQAEHFATRRKLFAEVDRLIRGRVHEVLGDVVLERKQELDKSLGLDALRKRVERVADGVGKDLDAISQQLEDLMQGRVEALLQQVQAEAADAVLKAFEKRVRGLVAKECGEQLARVLGSAPKAAKAPKPAKPMRIIPRPQKKRRG